MGKRPGPDGFKALYYRKLEDVLASHLTAMYNSIKNGQNFSPDLLAANIVMLSLPGNYAFVTRCKQGFHTLFWAYLMAVLHHFDFGTSFLSWSAALYDAPLAEATCSHPDIKCIEVAGSSHKISLFADDILLTLTSPRISLPNLFSLLKAFASLSVCTRHEALSVNLSPLELASLKANFLFQWPP